MTNLVLTVDNNGQPVVSTRKVAEDFGRDHSKIIRSTEAIKAAIDQSEFGSMFTMAYYDDSYGRPQKEYIMNRDGWTLLTMGLNGAKAMQWKLKYIAAFNEMEQRLALPNFANPAIAARAWADVIEAKGILEAKVTELEPKARAYDIFIDNSGYYSVGTVAKMLGTGRNRLFAFLAVHKIIMDNNEPYQSYVNKGYFVVKAGTIYVSPKGVQWLSLKVA